MKAHKETNKHATVNYIACLSNFISSVTPLAVSLYVNVAHKMRSVMERRFLQQQKPDLVGEPHQLVLAGLENEQEPLHIHVPPFLL